MLLEKGGELTDGIDEPGKAEILTIGKRKALSPPNPCQTRRAIKFQAAGEGASPDLRIRSGLDTKKGSPPSVGILSSPALGRIKKCKRRITTPKRTYAPDKKQLLITSVFSPRQ